jgi:hypothetical protein
MFNELIAALKKVSENVYHYERVGEPDDYIVWAEDGAGDTAWADGGLQNQSVTGTIDWFFKEENLSAIAAMQDALFSEGISFEFLSSQYEDDTKYIHMEWRFEIG